MKILVPVQFVPDLVEELVIDERGDRLDPYSIRWKVNEFDDHAIEQAILLKEKFGGQVTILAPGFDGAEDVLFNAAAKGADRIIRLEVNYEEGISTHAMARLFLPFIQEIQPDLVLTGVQAYNSLDGCLGSILAAYLDWSYVGYVSCIKLSFQKLLLRKEYPGGLTAQLEVQLPLVVGVQAAETPPRYVPIARVRQAMKTCPIEEKSGEFDSNGGIVLNRLYPPDTGTRAILLGGTVDQVADQLVAILREQGAL